MVSSCTNRERSCYPQIRDLKLSPFGTITFLAGSRIYEIDYNGRILWQMPAGNDGNDSTHKDLDKINTLYHHEFTRLHNGHYMALGAENLLCKLPSPHDASFRIIDSPSANAGIQKADSRFYSKIQFGTLVEYDERGNVVWSWHTSKYIMASDLLYNETHNSLTDLHDNSFFFDEQNKTAYISFKGVSRVIKVKYPEGNVLNTYGVIYSKDMNLRPQLDIQENRYPFFCGQHACGRSQDGDMFVFNNGCDPKAMPEIVMMQEPPAGQADLKKVWGYQCSIDDIGTRAGLQINSGGGNIVELPDHSLFASMGYQCNKVFIVNRDKEILWSAISETCDTINKTWKMIPSYRSNIITGRKEMEALIWNVEK